MTRFYENKYPEVRFYITAVHAKIYVGGDMADRIG